MPGETDADIPPDMSPKASRPTWPKVGNPCGVLAESNDPLIIDQPEDDLDNAFIFSSVVRTLRYIKERRQVFIVTHNANIAVLGDSELGRVPDHGGRQSAAHAYSRIARRS